MGNTVTPNMLMNSHSKQSEFHSPNSMYPNNSFLVL